jgi:hypothetical protein
MKYISFNITLLVALCMSVKMHAMSDWFLKEKQKEEFKEYLDNGNPWGPEGCVTDDRILQIKQRYSVLELAPSDAYIKKETALHVCELKTREITLKEREITLATGEIVSFLPQGTSADKIVSITSPSTRKITKEEIASYYAQYQRYVVDFVEAVLCKQAILARMKQREKGDDLMTCFKNVERCMLNTSKLLAAIRASGEEHYLCLEHDNARMGNHTYYVYHNGSNGLGMRGALWQQYGLDKVLLDDWGKRWMDGGEGDKAWSNLDPTSMAIIRHQLYKGFQEYYYNGLNHCYQYCHYKKTTEYTGPAICRIKKSGEEPRDISFATLMAALTLAEEKADKKENNEHKQMNIESRNGDLSMQ